MNFSPKLEILPASQRLLWDELHEVPLEFTLYDGTAVALHLGHRQSLDFDFFGVYEFNPSTLYSDVLFLKNSTIIQQEKNTLTCLVGRGEPVKVSFFGLPHIRSIKPAYVAAGNHLKVASLVDLAGMKALVVQQRAEAKDYIDVDAMIAAGIDLPMAISAATMIFGSAFNPQITLKALSYFSDGDLQSLPDDMKHRIVQAVAATDLDHLPNPLPDNV